MGIKETMDPVNILISEVENISLSDKSDKLRKDEEAFRPNQDIFTEEKKTGEKIINTSESSVKKTVKTEKGGPPCFKLRAQNDGKADRLSSETPAHKLGQLRDRISSVFGGVDRKDERTPICSLGPGLDGQAVPVYSADRDDDDQNPAAKARRQNRSPEGPVDALDTPAPNLMSEPPSFTFVPAPLSPEYEAFSPESGYGSPPPELPREVDDLLDRFFRGEETMDMDAVVKNLYDYNLDQRLVDKVLTKIGAYIQGLQPGNMDQEEVAPVCQVENEQFRFDSPAPFETVESLDELFMPFVDPNEITPSPVPVTVEQCTPLTSSAPAISSSKRSLNADTYKPDAKGALKECLKGKMRTEPGCFGGSIGVRRPMTDLTNYVQNLSAADKENLEKCRTHIARIPDGKVLEINERGDTILHTYMIFSPEKDCAEYPPRCTMRFLVYCLLERLDKMKKLAGSEGLINKKNDKGQTPLYLAACAVNFPEAVQMFLHHGADPNLRRATKDMDGPTPLHKVLERGDDCLPVLNHLLSSTRCDPNLLNSEGLTPLMIACRSHRTLFRNPDTSETSCVSTAKCVQMLLNCGRVDLFATSASSGRTALHYAVEKGDVELVRVWQPFAKQLDSNEMTAQKTPCKLINVTDRDGNTVLHILAGLQLDKNILTNMARQLLAMEADVTKRNGEKKIARELAKSMKNTELAEQLQMPKPRRTSNQSRQRAPIQSQSSDDSNLPDFSQSYQQSTFNFGGVPSPVFQGQISDDSAHSAQSYSPPRAGAPLNFQVQVCEPNSYVPNGTFIFSAPGQSGGFGQLSGGQAIVTTQYGFAGHSPSGQYTTALSPQHAGRTSPPESQYVPTTIPNTLSTVTYQQAGHSPLRAGQFPQQHSPLGAGYSAGGHSAGGHSPQGGHYSPAQYQISPHHSPQAAYQGGHSPQGALAQDAFTQPGLHTYTGQYVPSNRQSPPTLSTLTNVHLLQPYPSDSDRVYNIE